MKQETKRKIEISNLHEFADSLILIDNRIERCKKHQASTIVLIAISAVICGADTWNSIEDFGKSKESFFAAKLSNFNGIPSHDTFNRFFSALDPLKFEESYRQWVQSILKCYSCLLYTSYTFIVRFLHSLNHIGSFLTLAVYQQVIGFLYTFPTFVTVHSIITTDD